MRDKERSYIEDEIDELAFEFYRKSGFNPPTRPNGFLDDHERAMWATWRGRATAMCGEEK